MGPRRAVTIVLLLCARPVAPQVMVDRPYDEERWADTFAEFGPMRETPWPGDK